MSVCVCVRALGGWGVAKSPSTFFSYSVCHRQTEDQRAGRETHSRSTHVGRLLGDWDEQVKWLLRTRHVHFLWWKGSGGWNPFWSDVSLTGGMGGGEGGVGWPSWQALLGRAEIFKRWQGCRQWKSAIGRGCDEHGPRTSLLDHTPPSLPDTGASFLGVGSAVIASWSRQGYH